MPRRAQSATKSSPARKKKRAPAPAGKRTSARKGRSKLSVAAKPEAPLLEAPVPTRWVKFVVALFLLPFSVVLTQTFFTAFARTTLQEAFWVTEEFWFFSLGVVLWLIAFFGLPRPLWLYVFGHELTHAITVWLMGGRVKQFKVSAKGGHIITNRVNTWIALSPYFLPIYSILAIVVYGIITAFYDLYEWRMILFAVIGLTWAFHLTFTLWMIPKGQSDLEYGGSFFSIVIIYLMNLLIVTGLLIIASPGVSLVSFGQDLLQNAVDLTALISNLVRWSPG